MEKKDRERFVEFLENTLIPDLRDGGRYAMAEDFEQSVCIIDGLEQEVSEKEKETMKNVSKWTDESKPLLEGKGDGFIINADICIKPTNTMRRMEMDKLMQLLDCIVRAYRAYIFLKEAV